MFYKKRRTILIWHYDYIYQLYRENIIKNNYTVLLVFLLLSANILFAQKQEGILDEELHTDFLIFKVDSLDNPSPGYMFYSLVKFNQKTKLGTYNVILDQDGKIYKYKSTNMGGADLRKQSL